VSASGIATGQSAGVATITAQSGSLSATADLVVEGSVLTAIQVMPQNSSLPQTIETQLKATGIFADGQSLDLTEAASWSSSTPSVATVSNAVDTAGIATGIVPGTTTITAVFAGQAGTATLTVTNATLNTIIISPTNPVISLGTSQQFVAQGTFSDGSALPITLQASWSSSNVAVATIKPNGLATSASAGTSTIQASLNGVNATTVMTVH
jgi:Big-like domain-containing protein